MRTFPPTFGPLFTSRGIHVLLEFLDVVYVCMRRDRASIQRHREVEPPMDVDL